MLGGELLEDAVEGAAMGALEVAELVEGDLGIGWAERRAAVDFELGAVLGEGVFGGVKHFAAEEGLAVLGDVDGAGVGLAVDGDLNRDCVEFGRRRWLERPEFELVAGAPAEEIADEGLGGLGELRIRRGGR